MLLFLGKSSRKNPCMGADNIDIGGRGIKCHFAVYFVQDCIFSYLSATAKNFQTILQMKFMRVVCRCSVKIKHY